MAIRAKGSDVPSDGSGQQEKLEPSLKANHAKDTGQPHKPDQEAQPSPKDRLSNLGMVVTVSYVVDGDTIDVTPTVYGRERIRLIGVDTPESSQPYAEEASAFTRGRLEGHLIALEFDVQRIDPYKRVLAYVYLPNGTMFNETLVREGYAQAAYGSPAPLRKP